MLKKLLVPFFIALGIIATFSKEVLIAYYFGTSEKVDVFKTASYLPYSFFQTLGTVFVGLYLPRVINEKHKTEKFTGQITNISIIITLLGITLAPLYMGLLAPGFNGEKKDELVTGTMICWAGFFFYSFYFHYRIKLQTNENNSLIASTSLINSITFIIFLFIFQFFALDIKYGLEKIFLLSAVVFIFIFNFLGRKTLKLTAILENFVLKSNRILPLSLLLVAIATHMTTVLPRIIDRAFLSTSPQGYISALDYAFNIQTAFLLMVGTTLSITYATNIAKELNNKKGRKKKIKKALIMSFFISLPIAILAYTFADLIIRLAYFRGAFTQESLTITSSFLVFILPTLPLMAVNIILLQIILGTQKVKYIIIPNFLRLIIKLFFIIILSTIGINNIPLIVGLSLFCGELMFLISGIILLNRYRNAKNT